MESRTFHSLELPRVLAYLAGFAVSQAGYRACLGLKPFGGAAKAGQGGGAAVSSGVAAKDLFAQVRREAALFEQGRIFALRSDAALTPFTGLEDEAELLAAPGAALDIEALFGLREMLLLARHMVEAMQDAPGADDADGWPLWTQRCRELPLPHKCLSALSRCLADDGHIKDEASPELALVREELRRLHQQCARKVKDFAAEYNILHFLQDAFMTLSSDRYVLPLKANFKGRLQGVIHDYSQTGETCYFEPLFLVEINNRLQTLKREEREEERKILIYLSALAREELPGIRAANAFLVELDVLFAKVALAGCYDGRMVDFESGRGVRLLAARHPLLALADSASGAGALRRHELIQRELGGAPAPEREAEEAALPAQSAASAKKPDRNRVIPSDLELLPGQQALVISGGNAGGKTVCLKSLGLIALMGLCALPVPVAAGSVLPEWTSIHAFIGDEQSLEDHVSTFTAQIRHLGRIWPGLFAASLVILDEFGAGTDPSQGAALAQAVVDSIMETGAFVVAATHFPALKAYALSTPGVRAASVLFDPQSGKPLFRLVYDQVGASRALDVAREHGLPEPVLRRAGQYLLINGEDSSALVERLNVLAVEREAELAALNKERAAFGEKKKRLEERFEAEREKLFSHIQAEAQKVLRDWKSGKASHKQALKELSRIRADLAGQAKTDEQAAAPAQALDLAALALRQRLTHVPWKRTGVLLEVDERKKRVRLDFDGVSLWADAKDIALAQDSGGTNGAPGGPKGVTGTVSASLPLTLDLRGLRADVAVSDLEIFLDRAILSGRERIEVIHGRGTGALRREVHAFLKNFPAVREFFLAPEDQGGDGMTIVELK